MDKELRIKPDGGQFMRTWLKSQLFGTPAYPNQSFANQTIIITGANTGLGLEAARHFYRLHCAKLVLAVRTVSKGLAAKEDIVRSNKRRSDAEAIEVWPLDLLSTVSVLAFVERVKEDLKRVDVLVENAGINYRHWSVAENFEQTIQVNVINTLLLALLLLPKLRETKSAYPESFPHLEIVSSEGHRLTKFNEINASNVFDRLNDQEKFNGYDRYFVSKLLEVLFVRELVARLDGKKQSTPYVTIDLVNPGLCWSELDRTAGYGLQSILFVLRCLLARSAEVGSRTLVYGACAGSKSHGEFMSDGRNQDVEKWIYEDVGKRAQEKVFEETMRILEARKPGITQGIGL